jgi:hypothetical protein
VRKISITKKISFAKIALKTLEKIFKKYESNNLVKE